MWFILILVIFIAVYFYATIKTKNTIKKKQYNFSKPSFKYCLYLLSIYSILPLIIVVIVGNLISHQLIKFFMLNSTHSSNITSGIIYQSILESIKQIGNLANPKSILTSSQYLSFYLNNTDLYKLYVKYHSLSLISNCTIVILALIVSIIFINHFIKHIKPHANFQKKVEKVIRKALFLCSLVAVITTIAIVLSLLVESISFFRVIPILSFLFGTRWTPENANLDPFHSFGILPLLLGTFLIAVIAIVVALIIAIPAAIYISQYMNPKLRTIVKPVLEILAGIPTIVYGFFAALVLAPYVVKFFAFFHLVSTSDAAIISGIIIGIMIVPFISSITDDVISSIPKSIKEGGLALGSMPHEVINKILLPIAMPGIISGVLLAFSRAIGETMIVVMVSGLTANLTFNPLNSVTTITTQVVNLVQGDQEFGSIKTLSLFALGFTLFCITLLLNLISFWVIKKFQKHIEG